MLLKFSEYCQGLTVSCSFLLLLFCFVLNRECCRFSSFSLRHSEAVMYLTRLLYFFPHKIIPILSYPQLSFGLWRNTPCFQDQPATSSTAINAGCTGYLTKDCMSEREAVHGGELQSSVLLLLCFCLWKPYFPLFLGNMALLRVLPLPRMPSLATHAR